jgi:hypothetical protein
VAINPEIKISGKTLQPRISAKKISIGEILGVNCSNR